MPRFFFNVYGGVIDLDDEGQEFQSWKEARLVAIQCAGNIIADDRKRIAMGEDWRMEVTDAAGLVLLHLDLSIIETAAIRKSVNGEQKNHPASAVSSAIAGRV